MIGLRNLAAVLGLVAILSTALFAADAVPDGAGKKAEGGEATKMQPGTKPSITGGSVTSANGKRIDYTATTGYMALNDEQGKLRANVFYVGYTEGKLALEGGGAATQGPSGSAATEPTTAAATEPTERDRSKRPVTFVFNGGPGAASVWLHLGAVGPRRLDLPADGTAPTAPFKVVENPYTWLPMTDLVFVDPVNTGYSRAATPEQAKEFLGVKEDVAGMGEFIRLYLTKNGRWGSAIYLAGESYGTTRAAGLANYLQERVGVSVSGVILISTVLNFATLSPGENNDLPYSLYLPTYAAVAWYHKKLDMAKHGDLDGLLKEAENFASTEYVTALAKGALLSDAEKQRIAGRISELTGLRVGYVVESNLRVGPSRFEKQLLRSADGVGDLVIGRYDGRIAGSPEDAVNDSQEYDPSLTGFFPAYTSAFNEYVRHTLKYENEIPYEVLSNRVYPWNWGSGGGDENGYLYVGNHLRDAMTQNPHLRLLVCSGRFDLATPYFATDYQIAHLGLAEAVRKNITQTYYPGGHMIYHVQAGLEKLCKDVKAFIQ